MKHLPKHLAWFLGACLFTALSAIDGIVEGQRAVRPVPGELGALILAVVLWVFAIRAWPKSRLPRQVVTMGLGLICIYTATAIGWITFWKPPERISGKTSLCLSNIKQLSLSMIMYAEDHDAQLPPEGSWRAASAQPRYDRDLRCP